MYLIEYNTLSSINEFCFFPCRPFLPRRGVIFCSMPCYNQKKKDKLGNPADDTDDTLKSDKNDNTNCGQAEASNTSTLTLEEVKKGEIFCDEIPKYFFYTI